MTRPGSVTIIASMAERESDESLDPVIPLAAATTRDFERVFNDFAEKLSRFVYGYVGSVETAQDLVGDVFLKLWRRLHEAEHDLGVEPVRDLEAYLYRSARHHAIDYLRRQKRETLFRQEQVAADVRPAGMGRPPDAERELAEHDLVAALQRAVDRLPQRQREITLLKWERQATNEEIGAALGISPNTVTEHFRRALARLRELLPQFRGDL